MNHIFMALKFKFTYLGRIEIRNKVLYSLRQYKKLHQTTLCPKGQLQADIQIK